MRYAIANFILWLLQPALGPLIGELDKNITSLIQRKVERAEVEMAEDGTLRASNPSTFVRIKPYEPSNG